MKGKIIVFIGGIRSGKSRLAEARFSREIKGRKISPVYLATLDSRLARGDQPLLKRIADHQSGRPAFWQTIEIGKNLAAQAKHQAMILDGLGLWVALRHKDKTDTVLTELSTFLASAKNSLAVLVLDEVGLGGVSASASARRFADLNGRVNQAVCAAAHEVWRVDAGLGTRIK